VSIKKKQQQNKEIKKKNKKKTKKKDKKRTNKQTSFGKLSRIWRCAFVDNVFGAFGL
jgi:hypothetical protein